MSHGYLSTNPATGENIGHRPAIGFDRATKAADAAAEAQEVWRKRTVAARAEVLRGISAALAQAREELARLLVLEIGKPIGQSLAEVDKCRALCEGYAGSADTLLADRPAIGDVLPARIKLRPLGVILGVMPWNFPYWQTMRFVVPNILLGNACLIKPAPNAAMSSLALAQALVRGGVPPHLVAPLLIDEASVAGLVSYPTVAGVSVTGSVAAGAAIAAAAGAAVKKVVLELGGSDPFIVLADADIEAAARAATRSRLGNAGQSCVSAKRFIVERPVHDQFVAALVANFAGQKIGDPADSATTIGPLARTDLRDTLHAQVTASVAEGAKIVAGGGAVPGPGYFYAPTVMVDVPESAPVWRDETFGPVAPVVAAESPEDALRLANDCEFGLGASVWTSSAQRAAQFAEDVDAGMVFVNEIVQSDWRVPFGGTRKSGLGRELALEGITEFANVKTHWYGSA